MFSCFSISFRAMREGREVASTTSHCTILLSISKTVLIVLEPISIPRLFMSINYPFNKRLDACFQLTVIFLAVIGFYTERGDTTVFQFFFNVKRFHKVRSAEIKTI